MIHFCVLIAFLSCLERVEALVAEEQAPAVAAELDMFRAIYLFAFEYDMALLTLHCHVVEWGGYNGFGSVRSELRSDSGEHQRDNDIPLYTQLPPQSTAAIDFRRCRSTRFFIWRLTTPKPQCCTCKFLHAALVAEPRRDRVRTQPKLIAVAGHIIRRGLHEAGSTKPSYTPDKTYWFSILAACTWS